MHEQRVEAVIITRQERDQRDKDQSVGKGFLAFLCLIASTYSYMKYGG